LYSSMVTSSPLTAETQATWPAPPPPLSVCAMHPGLGVLLTLTPVALAALFHVLALPQLTPLYWLWNLTSRRSLMRQATKEVHSGGC
jgi:hypothetical protein